MYGHPDVLDFIPGIIGDFVQEFLDLIVEGS